ncbi:MAG: histidinol-phosphatase [Marvinbryantia sp.]
MIANYHTHTWRCMHATGQEREYVENAISGGIKILGFSDHTPMPYSDGHVSNVKMGLDQLEDYVDMVLRMKREYEKDIEIHLGLEVEYYPKYFEELLRITGQYPIEYFLLGQHFLGNEIGEPFSGDPTTDDERLERYCKQSEEALKTECFTYFAHPDLLNYTGDLKIYDKYMRRLCCLAKELDIPLEINFLGIWDQRHYPNPEFWKIAGEVGNKVIFGADAHQPDKVWNLQALLIAQTIVQKYNLNLIHTVDLRAPKM